MIFAISLSYIAAACLFAFKDETFIYPILNAVFLLLSAIFYIWSLVNIRTTMTEN